MNEKYNISQSGIFYSCTEREHLVKEYLVPDNVLTHVYSGKLLVKEADKTYTINEGDSVLFSKNHLAKITKYPGGDQPFKSITIFFDQVFLQQYYARQPKQEERYGRQDVIKFGKQLLLDSLFNSILPYYEITETLPGELVTLKLTEAITIIRKLDPAADAIFSDFTEPGKIDISGFMHKNYAFNIPIERFAYLTGRSLATFKRDFQKIFNTSPKKWLQQKRLEQAHYLIAEKNKKPSDTYLEVGFENFSHFSYAFKQWFGYNPSRLLADLATNNS